MTVAKVYETIWQTDFYDRAEAIAKEVKKNKPLLIGLQEVSLIYRQSPGDSIIGGTIPAEEVDLDNLEILMDALKARKLKYKVAAVVENADVEFPMLTAPPPTPAFDDVRLVDRDVILVREDLDTSAEVSVNYKAFIPIEVPEGEDIKLLRGFTAVTVDLCGEDIRFYNTHLETRGDAIDDTDTQRLFKLVQAAQMAELLFYLRLEANPVILSGDFNSGPADVDDIELLSDGKMIGSPYGQALAAGLIDMWNEKKKPKPGLTCCFNETVDDPEAELYERIDILFIDPKDLPVKKIDTKIRGDKTKDMTKSGLWPSDHAGVTGKVKLHKKH
jgi:hypothetical protein